MYSQSYSCQRHEDETDILGHFSRGSRLHHEAQEPGSINLLEELQLAHVTLDFSPKDEIHLTYLIDSCCHIPSVLSNLHFWQESYQGYVQ